MAKHARRKGNGICYECDKTQGLTFVSWYPITPTAENDWKSKGADLCKKHDAIAVSNYVQGK